MGLAEEIEKLNDLRQNGAISEEEFHQAKESLLAKNRPAGQKLSQAEDSDKEKTGVTK